MCVWYYVSVYCHVVLNKLDSVSVSQSKTSVRLTLRNDTPYIARKGELWGVFRQLYEEKCPWYIESALYHQNYAIADPCLSIQQVEEDVSRTTYCETATGDLMHARKIMNWSRSFLSDLVSSMFQVTANTIWKD